MGRLHARVALAKHAENAASERSNATATDHDVPSVIPANAAVYTPKMRDESPGHQELVFRISRRL